MTFIHKDQEWKCLKCPIGHIPRERPRIPQNRPRIPRERPWRDPTVGTGMEGKFSHHTNSYIWILHFSFCIYTFHLVPVCPLNVNVIVAGPFLLKWELLILVPTYITWLKKEWIFGYYNSTVDLAWPACRYFFLAKTRITWNAFPPKNVAIEIA